MIDIIKDYDSQPAFADFTRNCGGEWYPRMVLFRKSGARRCEFWHAG